MSSRHKGAARADLPVDFQPKSRPVWVSLGSAVLSVLQTVMEQRSRNSLAVPDYGRGPLILDFS